MPFNLRNRSFLKELDFTPDELRFLLKLSAELKAAKYGGYEQPRLEGKNIALIFEKTSTRTRTAFEVAAKDQGAHVTYLEPSGSQIGHKESMKDTARVLGRTFDGIEYRGFGQENVEILAEYAGVPVWNGLTDEFHPTQILADMLTMTEHSDKHLTEIAYCYLGDARNNMGNSLMVGGCKLGMDVRLCAPEHLWPADDLVKTCREIAERDRCPADPHRRRRRGRPRRRLPVHRRVGVDGRGQERLEGADRAAQAVPGQRGRRSDAPGTRTSSSCTACRRSTTARPRWARRSSRPTASTASEVTDDVFESEASIVFDQAENRLHTIKAVMVATLGS